MSMQRTIDSNSDQDIRVGYQQPLHPSFTAVTVGQEVKNPYQTAVRLHPHDALAWLNLGLVYLDAAQQYQNEVLPQHISQMRQLFSFSYTLLLANTLQFVVAESVQQAILSLFAVVVDGAAQAVDNRFKSAIQYFYQANACHHTTLALKNNIKSNLVECIAQYGHYLYKNGEFTNAQKYYLQAQKLDPDHVAVLNQMGMCLFKLTQFSVAREYFQQIIERSYVAQERADAWLNIAHTFIEQKLWHKAAKALREAKYFAPNDELITKTEKDLMLKMVFAATKTPLMFGLPITMNAEDMLGQLSLEI